MACNNKENWYILTEEEKTQINTMFFGPYKKEWKDEYGIVNNSDEAIGERLNIPTRVVSRYIYEIVEKKFSKLNRKINKR